MTEMWMLSNRQPWVEALLQGWITCKTRSIFVNLPPAGSIVFLHASKALWGPWKKLPWTRKLDVPNLPRGGVVGVAQLAEVDLAVDIMPNDEVLNYFMVQEAPGNRWCCADDMAMKFQDIHRLPFIPCRGAMVPTRKLPPELENWLEDHSLPFNT